MDSEGKYKILIADDDISIIKDIIFILIKNPDYVILTTSNGMSACQIAIAEAPDLIIMDWQMPVMDGIEATRQLNLNEETKDIPVIISTGTMLTPSDLSCALLAGAVDYLRKPVDEIELTARVANVLKLSAAHLKIKQQNGVMQSQLASRLVNIQQLNELKFATIKQLAIIKEQASNGDSKILNETIGRTESLLYSRVYDINWDHFESHFEFVHQGFFKALQTIYSHFSTNELRLCAFIKLNMSNKEIASIIYTSPDSVNTARKRLKKKLGLLPRESLQLFIRNLQTPVAVISMIFGTLECV